MKGIEHRPLYSIGIVSELLDVHPETIRTWERSGLMLPPRRRSGKRTFSGNDLKRLQFIQSLAQEGLSLRAIRYYLRLYPCWHNDECTNQSNCPSGEGYTKPCWREPDTFCTVSSNENLCATCNQNEAETSTPEQEVPSEPEYVTISRKQDN